MIKKVIDLERVLSYLKHLKSNPYSIGQDVMDDILTGLLCSMEIDKQLIFPKEVWIVEFQGEYIDEGCIKEVFDSEEKAKKYLEKEYSYKDYLKIRKMEVK